MWDGSIDERAMPIRSAQNRATRRACAGWWAASGGGGALPRLAEVGPDAPPLLFLRRGAARWDDPVVPELARIVRHHARKIGRPTRFRAELPGDGGVARWTGLLLPYADGNNRLAAWVIFAERHEPVDACEQRRLVAAAVAEGSAPARLAGRALVNPWRAAPFERADPPSCPEDRLQDARTWAALAVASPTCRDRAVPHALATAAAAGVVAPEEGFAAPRADADAHNEAATIRDSPAEPIALVELRPTDLQKRWSSVCADPRPTAMAA